MASALVHIGLPKCGSTTIQAFLTGNRSALARHGYAVQGGRRGETRLAFAGAAEADMLLPDDTLRARHRVETISDQEKLAESLAWQIGRGRGRTCLMSCEQAGAALETGGMPAALDRWLMRRFTEVRYLLVVRPQADYMLSAYSEALRAGRAQTLEEFLAGYNELNVRAAALTWRQALGERLTILRLPKADGKSLLDRFVRWAGLPNGLRKPAVRNRALGRAQARTLLAVNRRLPPPPRVGMARIIAGGLNRLLPLAHPRDARHAFTADQLRMIERRWPEDIDDLVAA